MTTANLTIQDNETVDQYTSVGESVFGFSFPITAAGELKVSKNNGLLTYGADWTLDSGSLNEPAGGSITLVDGSDPGDLITIWLDMPIERTSGYSAGAATLLAEDLNADQATTMRIMQMLRRNIGRSLRLPVDDTVAGQSMELPLAALRANKYLRFSSSGAPELAEELEAGTTLSQDTIGLYLYPLSLHEQSVGLTADDIVNPYLVHGHAERYGNWVNASTDFSDAIQKAFNVCHGHVATFTPNRTYRANSTLTFPATYGHKVEGRGAVIDSYAAGAAIGFALVGGTTYPSGGSYRDFSVYVNGGSSRSGIIVRTSYALFEQVTCLVRAGATSGKGFVLFGDEDNGSGPYYNVFVGCNVEWREDGQIGVLFATTAPVHRASNANQWFGGRVSGVDGVAFRINGAGNFIYGVTVEGTTGTAFDFVTTGVSNCTQNSVIGCYLENPDYGFVFDAGALGNTVIAPYVTGVANLWTDNNGSNQLIQGGSPWIVSAGITFPAQSSDANALDYYAEGSFTPGLTFATPGTLATVAGAANAGRYTRIGNRVFFDLDLDLSTLTLGTASGDLHITGLPFAAASAAPGSLSVGYHTAQLTYAASRTYISAQVIAGQQYLILSQHGTGVATSNLAVGQVTGGSGIRIQISGSYRV